MRVTIVFFLTLIILALAVWMWYVNPSRLQFFSGQEASYRHDQMDKINGLNDVESLKAEAIDQLLQMDKKVLQREAATMLVQNLLFVITGLLIIVIVILFYEIASRGRTAKT